MKKIIGVSLPFLVLFVSTSQHLVSKVTFGSRESAFRISSGARLNNSSSNLTVDGTLVQDNGADVTGNVISFKNGVLEDRGIEVVMTALFDPTGNDAVRLVGNGRFRAEPGTLIPALTVANQNNRLEGQPLFSGPITLANSTTELTIALQNMLNQSIDLNGGHITLDDHLHFADDVRFNGSGTIDLNNRQLSLGSSYSAPWTNSLLFKDALDISLNGNIDLTGTWTFSGVCSLHGNGSVINMVDGGQIILDPNTTLYLDDVFVRGLGDIHGKFVFADNTSQIRSSNSTFRLVSDYLIDTGSMYIEGPTTFALDGNNWTFDVNGKLTVDGVTLWLDPLDAACSPGSGQLQAPLPIFDGNVWNGPNVAIDIASGHLSLINRGSIKEVVDRSEAGISDVICELFDGGITTSLNLNQCVCVGPFQQIKIDGNVCINGNGTVIQFTDPNHPQLIVSAGKILTLKNVTLARISANTIDMRQGSRINIDEGVVFEFSEDVTFSQGLLSLTPSCTPNAGDGYIFTMRGNGCRKKIDISPLVPTQLVFNPVTGQFESVFIKALQLRVNTLQLDNIELGGFSAISQTNNPLGLSGAVALSCNAAVDIDVDTDMNFFVEGPNNDLVMQDDGITLSGNLAFGDFPDNTLHVKSVLTAPLDPTAPFRTGVSAENPVLQLAGDPGIFVFSNSGLATIVFDDFTFSVRNENENAFVVDNNSYMTFDHLEILDNAIKQSSANFRFDGLQFSGLQINPAFIRAPQGFMGHANIVPTAIYMQRQKERERYSVMQTAAQKQHKINAAKQQQKQKQAAAKKKPLAKNGKNKLRDIEALEGVEALDDRVFGQDDESDIEKVLEQAATRALHLPPVTFVPRFDQSYTNITAIQNITANGFAGNLRFNRSQFENFIVGADFNILLQNGSELTQGPADAVLDRTHVINVSGISNVINVRRTLTINNGGLRFPSVHDATNVSNTILDIETDTELTFQFISDGTTVPTVILNQDNLLLEPNVTLRFAGRGTVILNNGKKITFNGTQDNSKIPVVTSRPSLVITDNALFALGGPQDTKASALMSGIGRLEVSDRGRLEITKPGSLVIGSANAPTIGSLANDMQIEVFDSAEVRMESDSFVGNSIPANLAKISIWHTNVSFVIENTGLLSIIAGGQLEINAKVNGPSKVLKQGKITEFSISRDGEMYIDALGRLVLANNSDGSTFQWRGKQGEFASTCGLVEYVDKIASKNFVGHLRALDPNLFQTDQLTSEQLVRLFVQEVPALTFSTVYTGEDNNKYLRTKNGTSVQLSPGDVVLSDDASGDVFGNDASGIGFSYDINGNRS